MSAPPRFSVIVPVWRQWAELRLLLADLAGQSAPGGFEVLVVDNEPPSAPPLALSEGVRLLPCPAPGSYAARNAGAALARGAWLVFTDADCRPRPGWLAALARAAEAHPRDLVAGPVEVESAGARPNPCEIYDMVRGIPQARYVARGYAATANLAVPRAAFDAVGGFEPGRFSGGDAVFCRRAGALGHGLRLAPEAVVAHPARVRLGGAERQGAAHQGRPDRRRPPAPPRRLAAAHPLAAGARRGRLPRLPPSPRPAAGRGRMRLRLWGVELAETARLLAGGPPERR
jgi:GT2 family glycosyltransferase